MTTEETKEGFGFEQLQEAVNDINALTIVSDYAPKTEDIRPVETWAKKLSEKMVKEAEEHLKEVIAFADKLIRDAIEIEQRSQQTIDRINNTHEGFAKIRKDYNVS